jgi:hypothetical protein
MHQTARFGAYVSQDRSRPRSPNTSALFLRSVEHAAAAAYSPTTQEIVDFFTCNERSA